eukprot:gene21172-24030_t
MAHCVVSRSKSGICDGVVKSVYEQENILILRTRNIIKHCLNNMNILGTSVNFYLAYAELRRV